VIIVNGNNSMGANKNAEAKKTPALVAGVGSRCENLDVVIKNYKTWSVFVNEK